MRLRRTGEVAVLVLALLGGAVAPAFASSVPTLAIPEGRGVVEAGLVGLNFDVGLTDQLSVGYSYQIGGDTKAFRGTYTALGDPFNGLGVVFSGGRSDGSPTSFPNGTRWGAPYYFVSPALAASVAFPPSRPFVALRATQGLAYLGSLSRQEWGWWSLTNVELAVMIRNRWGPLVIFMGDPQKGDELDPPAELTLGGNGLVGLRFRF